MCCTDIPHRDSLYRLSVFPVSFRGKRFAKDKFLPLKTLEPDGPVLMSLAWERFAPTTDDIHAYGCRMASRRNQKLIAVGKPLKGKNRQVYCGAYQMRASAVRLLAAVEGLNEILSADVIHQPEDGELAHANLTIALKAGGDIESAKTAIVDRLWRACAGPLKHQCFCDRDVAPHPNSDLETAPKGLYIDGRSRLGRLWHVARSRICEWLWHSFPQKMNARKGSRGGTEAP